MTGVDEAEQSTVTTGERTARAAAATDSRSSSVRAFSALRQASLGAVENVPTELVPSTGAYVAVDELVGTIHTFVGNGLDELFGNLFDESTNSSGVSRPACAR